MRVRERKDASGLPSVRSRGRRAFLGRLAAAVAALSTSSVAPRSLSVDEHDSLRDQPFDDNWRFLRGETPGAEQPEFNDRSWRTLDLPHDWSIEDLPGNPLQPTAWTA